MPKRLLAALLAVLLGLGSLWSSSTSAQAAPPTASWSATAGGNVAGVSLSAAGLTLANAQLANSLARASSTTTPRTESRSRNIAASVVGLPITVESNSQTAPPDLGGPATGSLAAVNALGIGVNALTTSNEAHWSGDQACVVVGPLAQTTTTTAGVSVNPVVADILTTGVSSTTGTTSLVSTGGNGLNRAVQSEARGSIAGVSVLGGAVTVEVVGEAVLTSTASGTPGGATVTYTAPVVRVTALGDTTTVALGTSLPLELGLVGAVTVAVNNPTQVPNPNGQSTTASVNVVTLTVRAGPAFAPLATATIQLIPLSADATAPAGGIDCPPPAPVLQTPADGSLTNDNTPTFSGTGVAGATINLTLDGTTTNTVTTVAGNGTWSYTPTTPIPDGDHTASVTQTVAGATSPASNANDFTIDTSPPTAPSVIAPANGSTTADPTPTISGSGPATTDIEVFIDGESVGTTTTNGAGDWQLDQPGPGGRRS